MSRRCFYLIFFHFRCLGENFGLSVREVTIRCDTPNHSVEEALSLLKKLSCNRQLRKLFLESSSSSFEYDDDNDDSPGYTTPLIKSLVKIIETSNRLEALSLGCIEELTASAAMLLEPLRLHHAKHLTTLSLASVRDEPDDYDFLQFDYEFVFSSFVRLSILTLDYEFITDYLLQALDNGTMERLVIHVHGWNDHYLGTTDSAWQNFIQKK